MSEWTSAPWRSWVSVAADLAQILSVLLLVVGFVLLKRATVRHLNSVLAAIRTWAIGPSGTGWSRDSATVAQVVRWSSPGYVMFQIPGGEAIGALNNLENFSLPGDVRRAITELEMSIGILNAGLDRLQDFDAGSTDKWVSVHGKLHTQFPDGVALNSAASGDQAATDLWESAGLTLEEMGWAECRAELAGRAFIELIGDESGRGVYRHLRNLEAVLRREGLFQEFVPRREASGPDA